MSRAPKINKTKLNTPPAARNFVDNTKMAYGEKTAMKKFLDDAPKVNNEIVTQTAAPQQIPVDPGLQKQLDLDTFAPTNKQFEPVTTGIGGKPRQMDTTRELIVELYNLTGDINLARLLR
tara:strand:+ start:53 stop:412 length:360 start_codon:yes stop_codon:yes gene_type:complete